MEQCYTGFECCNVGLMIHEEYQFLAATPDGITRCNCCDGGVLEIKCPYCTSNDEPDLAKFLADCSLQKDHKYYYQIQTQMFVCSMEHGNFVVCTFPNGTPTISVERIYLDVDFIVSSIVQAGNFFTIAVLPEILGRWYTHSVVIPNSVIDDTNTTDYNYCYCKEEKGGEMVCCDSDKCPYGQWFHLCCLKLNKVPCAKKWYCPDCQKHQAK